MIMDARWPASPLVAVLVLLVCTNTLEQQCKDRDGCTCQMSHSGDFEIYCPTDNQSAFIVNIQPTEYIHVRCSNSPAWTDFRLTGDYTTKTVRSVYFKMCGQIPSNFSLALILRRLGAENTESLVFQSYQNLSTSLTEKHLEDLGGLKKLILSSNGLSNISSDLLSAVPLLNWLDLRENNIKELSSDTFALTPQLEVLELGNNAIRSLVPGTFNGLTKLRLLNLWKNRIKEIDPRTFDNLVSLKSLDVNTNVLRNLPSDVFANLTNLETLNLFGNNFSSLPEDLFRNNLQLRTVNLYNNKRNLTTLPRGFFRGLARLRTVKLKRNGLLSLPEDLFWGASSLANVSLERNYLTTLPEGIFRDTVELRMLDLSVNDLDTIPDYIFYNASGLVKLNLSRNRMTSISRGMFEGLKSLEELNMEMNQLTVIHDLSFVQLKQLRIVKFSDNQLTLNSSSLHYQDEFGTNSPFHSCIGLEELHLAKNNISQIFSDWIVSHLKLRILDLKYNNLPMLSSNDLQFLSNNIRVDLTYNNITRVHLSSAERVAIFQRTPRDVIILLDHNPIRCDCYLYDFLRYLEGKMHSYVQNYFHIIPGNLSCHAPLWLEDIALSNLRSDTLKCIISDATPETKCPKQCTCWMRPNDNAYLVNCSYRNFTHIPTFKRKTLGPKVQYDTNTTLIHSNPSVPSERVELNFTGNLLTEMPSIEQMGLERVSTLLLSHNNISKITLNGLTATLEVLELHDNNLTRMDRSVLEFLKNTTLLTRLTLHGNPWKCDCEAREFLNFIQTMFVNIPDLLQVYCEDKNVTMQEMTADELCPVETMTIVGISLTVALTGLIAGAIAAAYYRYQQEIKVWLYAHQWCLWFVTEDDLDKDKLYDAFISYSHKDEDFVINELVHKLESGPRPFKLCLHFRDWLAGEWIPTQIARSVEDSKRTIVILSPNFLESIWGRMEFRAAHRQALSEGRARVILILYGDIGPTDALDAELKAYISMNTYVKWGDPWFWDKLRYALPHPPEFMKTAIGKKIFERHHPHIQISGEKKELIKPPGVPETPPAITTPPADSLKVFICDESFEKKILSNEDCSDTLKTNGAMKPILTENEELVKNHSKVNQIQCTTV